MKLDAETRATIISGACPDSKHVKALALAHITDAIKEALEAGPIGPNALLEQQLAAERTRTAALEVALGRLIPFVETSADLLEDEADPDEIVEAREAVADARALLPAKQAEGAQPQEGK